MSEGTLMQADEVPIKGRQTWQKKFEAIPAGMARFYEGKNAQVAYVMFYRLKRAEKLPAGLTVQGENVADPKKARVAVRRAA